MISLTRWYFGQLHKIQRLIIFPQHAKLKHPRLIVFHSVCCCYFIVIFNLSQFVSYIRRIFTVKVRDSVFWTKLLCLCFFCNKISHFQYVKIHWVDDQRSWTTHPTSLNLSLSSLFYIIILCPLLSCMPLSHFRITKVWDWDWGGWWVILGTTIRD